MALMDDSESHDDSGDIGNHEGALRKPKIFQQCLDAGLGSRVKCPFASCEHNITLSITRKGLRPLGVEIGDGSPDLESIQHTCAVQSGPLTLQEIGAHFGMTRERVRQIEEKALNRLLRRGHEQFLELLEQSEVDRCAL